MACSGNAVKDSGIEATASATPTGKQTRVGERIQPGKGRGPPTNPPPSSNRREMKQFRSETSTGAIHTILGKTESSRCAVPFKLRELADELEAGKIPKT
jgi:hypothetical protein